MKNNILLLITCFFLANNFSAQNIEVIGSLKIVDGTQGIDRVLTSDSNGLASWQLGSNLFPSTAIVISDMEVNNELLTHGFSFYGKSKPEIFELYGQFGEWTPTSTGANVPDARTTHTAVWTGTDMIIWGGSLTNGGSYANTGAQYDPSTDSWTPTSTGANVPSSRQYHTAIWTGTEMIVWGGYNGSIINTGGIYDPSSDSWIPTSTGANVPNTRYQHTAVWTGTKMIVWGGYDGSFLTVNTGGTYNPSTDSWAAVSTGINAPVKRSYHTAIWTGTHMIIWGGLDGGQLNTGGIYDPVTDSWTAISTGANVPSPRQSHTAIWTGTHMIVWGGYYNGNPVNTGGIYDPVTDTWETLSISEHTPYKTFSHSSFWTGSEMIAWGGSIAGYENSGGIYDPLTGNWSPTSTGLNVPSTRISHTSVWTGTHLIVWGGHFSETLNSGGIYNPNSTIFSLAVTSKIRYFYKKD